MMFNSELISAFVSLAGAIAVAFTSYFYKSKFDVDTLNNQNDEINKEVRKVLDSINKNERDVLSLMVRNVAELREYYVINKQQAIRSFSAALIISILGFILFASGFALAYMRPETANSIPYSTASGAIVEIIAGLFFWLYNKAIKQINIFHSSLQSTEKFLTAIQLVDKISLEKKDDLYKSIIEKIISSSFMPGEGKPQAEQPHHS